MLFSKKPIHFVDGKQLCNDQYNSYLESSAFDRGYKAGVKEVVEWIIEHIEDEITFNSSYGEEMRITIFADKAEWQAKLKEWGIE